MHNDLIRYASGDVTPRRLDRDVAQRAKGVYDETRLGALKVDAVMALGAHVMESSANLIGYGRSLAGNDPQVAGVMGAIASDTMRQAQNIQRQTFNRFGI